MAAVEVTISGVLYDRVNRTAQNVVLIGEATLSGVGVGGGPIYPPSGGGGGGGEGIWGPTDPRPTPPIHLPPGSGGGGGPIIPVPPDSPHVPPPGSPPMIIGGTHPTNPMEPPPAVVIEYPGIGKVVVPKPTDTAPRPEPKDQPQAGTRR